MLTNLCRRILCVSWVSAAAAIGCADEHLKGSSSSSAAETSATAGSGPASSGAGGAGSVGGEGGSAGGMGGTGAAGGMAGAGGDGGMAGSGGGFLNPALCYGKVYACGDLVDNDGDGLVDADDPECLNACDNSEDLYFWWVLHWDEIPCNVECFFDNDPGKGNDECFWNHRCDPLEAPPSYYPEPEDGVTCAYDPNVNVPGTPESCASLAQAQGAYCHQSCGPLVPNGCDYFGCCELPAESGNFVWLGSVDAMYQTSCTLQNATDPALCHPCTPVPSALKTCELCDLCIGKTQLPAPCAVQQCPAGADPCGLPGQASCPQGTYCVTGCCQLMPF